jgi:hypothetical protein
MYGVYQIFWKNVDINGTSYYTRESIHPALADQF